MKTLIAEDDFTCRLLLQSFLLRYGECHVAVNGEEAVEAFYIATEQGNPYDLVCLDIIMPGLDGKKVAKRLRAMEEARGILFSRGAKIIMTTGLDTMKDVSESFDALCDDYLTKPVDLGKLMNQLKSYKLIA